MFKLTKLNLVSIFSNSDFGPHTLKSNPSPCLYISFPYTKFRSNSWYRTEMFFSLYFSNSGFDLGLRIPQSKFNLCLCLVTVGLNIPILSKWKRSWCCPHGQRHTSSNNQVFIKERNKENIIYILAFLGPSHTLKSHILYFDGTHIQNSKFLFFYSTYANSENQNCIFWF